jgi:phage I-like protein
MKITELILDAIELSEEPPTEITLFKAGWTDTKKGRFLFDEKAQEMVMQSAKTDGRDLIPFDIGHGMLSGTDEGRHKAAGWFKLEVGRYGDLLATDIEWTPKTREALENREYRFHSPAIGFDPKTRRVARVLNVALTNMPATNNQTPLVLDSSDVSGGDSEKETLNMKLEALLGVTEDKVEEAVATLHREHADLKQKHIEALAETVTVKKELSDLKEAARLAERKAEIAVLSSEGKLTPACVPFAESLSDSDFEAYKKTLVADKSLLGSGSGKSPEEDITSLSDEEKQVAKYMGVSEEKFIEYKKGSK